MGISDSLLLKQPPNDRTNDAKSSPVVCASFEDILFDTHGPRGKSTNPQVGAMETFVRSADGALSDLTTGETNSSEFGIDAARKRAEALAVADKGGDRPQTESRAAENDTAERYLTKANIQPTYIEFSPENVTSLDAQTKLKQTVAA